VFEVTNSSLHLLIVYSCWQPLLLNHTTTFFFLNLFTIHKCQACSTWTTPQLVYSVFPYKSPLHRCKHKHTTELSKLSTSHPHPRRTATTMSTSEAVAAPHVIPIYDDTRQQEKAPVDAAPPRPPAAAAPRDAPAPVATAPRKCGGGVPFFRRPNAASRCVALIDFLLRIAAFGPTLAAVIATATADETLSVFTHYYQFRARWDEFPALVSVSPPVLSHHHHVLYFFAALPETKFERNARVQAVHGGERDRGGVPGAVPPLLRHSRPAPTGHRLAPSPGRLRHGELITLGLFLVYSSSAHPTGSSRALNCDSSYCR
jgi:hypothetical protein